MVKLSTHHLVTYVALALALVLAFYFYKSTRYLESGLLKEQERGEALQKKWKIFGQLSTIDSLLFVGEYTAALDQYESLKLEKDLGMALEARIRFAKELLNGRKGEDALSDTIKNPSNNNLADRATPQEVRQYDSLQFALAKAKVQVENLKQQVKDNNRGEYLVFATSKGDKIHYVGEVRNKKANGYGIALFETGSRYEGFWKDNQRHGKSAFYWPDGDRYVGDYEDDRRSGYGTYYWSNGEKYIGQWKNDQRNGKGTFYGKEGEIVAQGFWKNDKLDKVQKEPNRQ